MEFNFRAFNKQAPTYHPPSPTSINYFSEQALRAGFLGSDFGRATEIFRNPSNVRESLQLEIEKEKIRAGIITAEIKIIRKRLLLDAGVGRGIMEGDVAALGRPEGLSFFSGAASALLHGPRLSLLNRCESRPIEERLALSLEERLGYRNHCGIGGLETGLFHRMAEPRIYEIRPSLEDTPEENRFGVKRKAVTSPAAGGREFHSFGLKKPKEEWSCAICQVSATSEQSLGDHFQGKKHKVAEALRQSALRTGEGYAIGLVPGQNRPALSLMERLRQTNW